MSPGEVKHVTAKRLVLLLLATAFLVLCIPVSASAHGVPVHYWHKCSEGPVGYNFTYDWYWLDVRTVRNTYWDYYGYKHRHYVSGYYGWDPHGHIVFWDVTHPYYSYHQIEAGWVAPFPHTTVLVQ